VNITDDAVKRWCLYLANLHQITGGTIVLPVSYNCPRRPNSMMGCGTCYQCTKELIMRVIVLSSDAPAGSEHVLANQINDKVFTYVTSLDERLNHHNGLGDDYMEMDSEYFGRVMQWAGTLEAITVPVTSSSQQDNPVWTPEPEPLKLVDEWGRPRCIKRAFYVDATETYQCALAAGHLGEHDPLADVPAESLLNGSKW
jgi:hypothetical protein